MDFRRAVRVLKMRLSRAAVEGSSGATCWANEVNVAAGAVIYMQCFDL